MQKIKYDIRKHISWFNVLFIVFFICKSIYSQDVLPDIRPEINNEFVSKKSDSIKQYHYPSHSSKKMIFSPESINTEHLHTNIVSINAMAMANGDLTLFYDKLFYDGKFAITFLGGYNFNVQMNRLNAYISNSKYNAKKDYDIGGGFYFAPNHTKRHYYFMGLLGKYMSYHFTDITGISNNQKQFQEKKAHQLAILFSNGWIFNIASTVHFKVICAVGKQMNSIPLKSTSKVTNNVDYSHFPKLYLGYCIGYRF